ncbi:hypothetical protein DdX_13181 [Ditylenchus destructor]|uniref:Uncharacterized protein n=1 Tax=Ditylenchus destructor TaxID=166010 RepID=A0AAD4MZ43_9BILA|nr:hypothetical protein DdX_13181 [Ditylenchus destructor]
MLFNAQQQSIDPAMACIINSDCQPFFLLYFMKGHCRYPKHECHYYVDVAIFIWLFLLPILIVLAALVAYLCYLLFLERKRKSGINTVQERIERLQRYFHAINQRNYQNMQQRLAASQILRQDSAPDPQHIRNSGQLQGHLWVRTTPAPPTRGDFLDIPENNRHEDSRPSHHYDEVPSRKSSSRKSPEAERYVDAKLEVPPGSPASTQGSESGKSDEVQEIQLHIGE